MLQNKICYNLGVEGVQEPVQTGIAGGVLPYVTYIRMCRYEGYGFQAVPLKSLD